MLLNNLFGLLPCAALLLPYSPSDRAAHHHHPVHTSASRNSRPPRSTRRDHGRPPSVRVARVPGEIGKWSVILPTLTSSQWLLVVMSCLNGLAISYAVRPCARSTTDRTRRPPPPHIGRSIPRGLRSSRALRSPAAARRGCAYSS